VGKDTDRPTQEGPISKSCLNDLLNEAEVVNFL